MAVVKSYDFEPILALKRLIKWLLIIIIISDDGIDQVFESKNLLQSNNYSLLVELFYVFVV